MYTTTSEYLLKDICDIFKFRRSPKVNKTKLLKKFNNCLEKQTRVW